MKHVDVIRRNNVEYRGAIELKRMSATASGSPKRLEIWVSEGC